MQEGLGLAGLLLLSLCSVYVSMPSMFEAVEIVPDQICIDSSQPRLA